MYYLLINQIQKFPIKTIQSRQYAISTYIKHIYKYLYDIYNTHRLSDIHSIWTDLAYYSRKERWGGGNGKKAHKKNPVESSRV